MSLAGTPTPRLGIRTFADTDVPDLAAGGLTLALTDIDNAIRYRGPLTVAQFGSGNYGLPTAPVDGDMVSLIADAANGIEWLLRYVAAEPTYKWRYLGGPALRATIATYESIGTIAAYVNLATDGPKVNAPRAGDYQVAYGAATADAGSVVNPFRLGAAAGNTTPTYSTTRNLQTTAADLLALSSRDRLAAVAALTDVKLRYYVDTGGSAGAQFGERWIEVTPIRIS